MEAEGSAIGAGGIGAASPAAGAGAMSPPTAPPPQLLHPPAEQPPPQLLPQQLFLHLWHLKRLAKKPQRFRLQQLLQPLLHESQAGCSQHVGCSQQAGCSQHVGCSQQFDWQHLLPQSNRPFSRPNRHSFLRPQQDDWQHDCCSQHDGSQHACCSQQAGSQQAGCSQQVGSQQLVSQH
jgi:hypothetical protein